MLIFMQIFELVTDQPPFTDFGLSSPTDMVEQMQELLRDRLPERWQSKWEAMTAQGGLEVENEVEVKNEGCMTLQGWLEELYFERGSARRQRPLTREDISQVGSLILKLMRFEPSERASAREILDDPWLQENSEKPHEQKEQDKPHKPGEVQRPQEDSHQEEFRAAARAWASARLAQK
jgi:serine/threonine-protein kinase SRPK3